MRIYPNSISATRATASALLIFAIFVLTQIIFSLGLYIFPHAHGLLTGEISIADVALLESYRTSPTAVGRMALLANGVIISVLWMCRLASPHLLMPRRLWVTPKWPLSVLAALLLSIGIAFLVEPLHLDDEGMTARFSAMMGDIPCILGLCVVGPLAEEMVFRDGILRRLIEGGLASGWAVVISALTFAIVHGNLAQALPAFLMGLFFGLLYLRTGDIRLSGLAHIANNTVAVLLMSHPEAPDYFESLSPMVCVGVGVVIFVSGIYTAYRWYRK